MKQRGQRWGKARPATDNIDVPVDEGLSMTVGYSLIWNGSEFVSEAL